jgi:hypothetical protein
MQEYRIMSHRVAESVMMERRITLRLLGYWEKLRGQRPMPSAEDILPEDIHDLWDSCMLLKISDVDKDDFHYSYMGESIRGIYSSDLIGTEQGSLAALNAASIMTGCRKVMETHRPLLDEGEFHNKDNELVKYRLCLLPLGEGQQVQAVLGGMRFKIYRNHF